MYLLIGKENCSRCDMVKNILDKKGINYSYQILDELDKDVKKGYLELARKAGKLEMPLIIKNNTIFDIKEVS